MSKHLATRVEFLLQALLKRTTACPHCASIDTRVVKRKYRVVRVRECARCLLRFTDPIYQPWWQSDFYGAHYSEGDLTTEVPDAATLAQLRASGYAATNKCFALRIAALAAWAGRGSWLELGSSWGYFLDQARTAGVAELRGIELSSPRRAYGCEHLELDLRADSGDFADQIADLVYSSHVLEHFTDVGRIFGELKRLLKPGGVLLIEVPNLDWETLGDSCLYQLGAVHPIGYTRRFFERLLPTMGFVELCFPAAYDSLGTQAPADRSPTYLLVQARLAA